MKRTRPKGEPDPGWVKFPGKRRLIPSPLVSRRSRRSPAPRRWYSPVELHPAALLPILLRGSRGWAMRSARQTVCRPFISAPGMCQRAQSTPMAPRRRRPITKTPAAYCSGAPIRVRHTRPPPSVSAGRGPAAPSSLSSIRAETIWRAAPIAGCGFVPARCRAGLGNDPRLHRRKAVRRGLRPRLDHRSVSGSRRYAAFADSARSYAVRLCRIFVVWDNSRGAPVSYVPDQGYFASGVEPALNGSFSCQLASGACVTCRPAFALLAERAAQYAPERSESITWVAADDVRRAARTFRDRTAVLLFFLDRSRNAQQRHADQSRGVLSVCLDRPVRRSVAAMC